MCIIKQINFIFFNVLIMCNENGTKLGLKLDWVFKICVQMTKIKGFRNPKSNFLKSN